MGVLKVTMNRRGKVLHAGKPPKDYTQKHFPDRFVAGLATTTMCGLPLFVKEVALWWDMPADFVVRSVENKHLPKCKRCLRDSRMVLLLLASLDK